MTKILKQIILIIITICLFIPLIQKEFTFFKEKPLKGVFTLAEKPDSMLENWFSGEYQLKYEKYFNDSLGFRPFFVRINNQISFSLFNTITTDNAILGIDKVVLDEKYIFANFGLDFLGNKYLESQADKLKFVQYKLKTDYNIDLLVIFAPSKVSFFADKIPEKYSKIKNDSTNYSGFVNEFTKKKINFIDFNKWFEKIKDTSEFELFPKYGIHWSYYGAILATDSLIKYMSNNKSYSMPKLTIRQIILTDSMAFVDNDVTTSMNLLFNPKYSKMPYTKFDIEKSSNKNIKLLVIGDSYYNVILNTGIMQQICLATDYLYYNKTYKINNKENKIDYNNYFNLIKKYNYIILLNTELNYWNLGHGFIELMYRELTPEMNTLREDELFTFYYKSEKIDSIKAREKAKNIINNTLKDYFLYKDSRIELLKKRLLYSFINKQNLINKAKERRVSLDEMAYLDGRYLFYDNLFLNKTREEEIRKNIELNILIENIKNDKQKLDKLKLISDKTKIPFNDVLLRYAKNSMNGNDNENELQKNNSKKIEIKQENVSGKYNENEIQVVIARIKNNKVWFDNIVQQAKEQNISTADMLRKNAIFTIKNRKK